MALLKPLQQWFCDKCGEIIVKPFDGRLVFKKEKEGQQRAYDFRIIHQTICDNKQDYPYFFEIECRDGYSLTDERGKEMLLSTLLMPGLPNQQRDNGVAVVSIKEFVDLFRRLQTPYYEEARRRFGESEVLESWIGDFAGFFPEFLKAIAEKD